MKKKLFTALTAAILSVLISGTAFALAGSWNLDENGRRFWYKMERDGKLYSEGWTTGGWGEIDGKLYFFDENGYMAHDYWLDGVYAGSDGEYKPFAEGKLVNYNNISETALPIRREPNLSSEVIGQIGSGDNFYVFVKYYEGDYRCAEPVKGFFKVLCGPVIGYVFPSYAQSTTGVKLDPPGAEMNHTVFGYGLTLYAEPNKDSRVVAVVGLGEYETVYTISYTENGYTLIMYYDKNGDQHFGYAEGRLNIAGE